MKMISSFSAIWTAIIFLLLVGSIATSLAFPGQSFTAHSFAFRILLNNNVDSRFSLKHRSHVALIAPLSASLTDLSSKERLFNEAMSKSADELKSQLITRIPSMSGTTEDFSFVESCVNALEQKFTPPLTLEFFNMAMGGEWQLLFTSNQLSRPSPKLRLTELVQSMESNGFEGKIVNRCSWSHAEDGHVFETHGTFTSTTSYKINEGARMHLSDDCDLSIALSKGSKLPSDGQILVRLIHRALPTHIFDPSNLGFDVTFLDADLKLVRISGARFEGVRDIFIRKGSIGINPTATGKNIMNEE